MNPEQEYQKVYEELGPVLEELVELYEPENDPFGVLKQVEFTKGLENMFRENMEKSDEAWRSNKDSLGRDMDAARKQRLAQKQAALNTVDQQFATMRETTLGEKEESLQAEFERKEEHKGLLLEGHVEYFEQRDIQQGERDEETKETDEERDTNQKTRMDESVAEWGSISKEIKEQLSTQLHELASQASQMLTDTVFGKVKESESYIMKLLRDTVQQAILMILNMGVDTLLAILTSYIATLVIDLMIAVVDIITAAVLAVYAARVAAHNYPPTAWVHHGGMIGATNLKMPGSASVARSSAPGPRINVQPVLGKLGGMDKNLKRNVLTPIQSILSKSSVNPISKPAATSAFESQEVGDRETDVYITVVDGDDLERTMFDTVLPTLSGGSQNLQPAMLG